MKEWYQKKREAILVFLWGWGMFAFGFILGKFVLSPLAG
ncbi:hypothetical protein ES703_04922 [subsurface metagenome]